MSRSGPERITHAAGTAVGDEANGDSTYRRVGVRVASRLSARRVTVNTRKNTATMMGIGARAPPTEARSCMMCPFQPPAFYGSDGLSARAGRGERYGSSTLLSGECPGESSVTG